MSEILEARANHVQVSSDSITLELFDGRTVSVPIAWYPRLFHGSERQRKNWRFIGGGQGIHWPDLDEDISVENLLAGKPSTESHRSLKRWLETHSDPSKRQQETGS